MSMPLLNVEQAAERLGTSPRFIRRLIAERRIPFTKLGKHVRIDPADLDAFIAAGRVEASPSSTWDARVSNPRSIQDEMRWGR
jgi:excisionase family DNA binding protein